MKKVIALFAVAALVGLASVRTLAQETPKGETQPVEIKPPSEQPKSGPGSSEYTHKKAEMVSGGEKSEKYYLYTPADPAPKEAPVICFIHGYNAIDPDRTYIGWIEHLVKRGNIVVFPVFQATPLEPPANYAPNCAKSMKLAFEYLEAEKTRVQPLKEKFAIVGHSAGGMTTGNLAAQWEELGMPKPLAAMPVQPGRAFGYDQQRDNGLIDFADYSKIPAETLLLCVYGDSDQTVGSYCAAKIFADAKNVPAENKNLVEVRSDVRSKPKMVCTHQTPGSQRVAGIDLFDWFGYWKLFDGLTDAAFKGKNREYALGGKAEQKFMGKCSDGSPFAEMVVTLGDAKFDPDSVEYLPAYKANGTPDKAKVGGAAPKNPAPKEPAPAQPGRKEERRKEEKKDDEEKEEEF